MLPNFGTTDPLKRTFNNNQMDCVHYQNVAADMYLMAMTYVAQGEKRMAIINQKQAKYYYDMSVVSRNW